MRRIAFFEFTVFPGVFPLASGNLEAAATTDRRLREQFSFEKFSMAVDEPAIATRVAAVEADIYAFSCYVWNMGLVRKLLRSLRELHPTAPIILGGPQVMHRAQHYLSPDDDRQFVCNGEGERTFPELLLQLCSPQPDFHGVKGISFYAQGQLITTAPQERIRDLNEVPSPYLTGRMDPSSSVWAVIETNRGCPFRCTYCYWGGATNSKVTKYSEDRVLDEITWLGDNMVLYLFIADANFGMLPRDVTIAEHIAATRQRTGYPLSVYFNSSKNTPERASQIAEVLATAGLVATLPISLQTMSTATLVNVKRENIRAESYLQMQSVLNAKQVSSFIELIWPLPGETLESFTNGIGDLCTMQAESFSFYPLLLIGNVEMEQHVEEFRLRSIADPDPNSEARIVIETRDVTHEQFLDGFRLCFHVTSLYSLRGLWHVARYLQQTGLISYGQLFSRFAAFCRDRPEHPYMRYIEATIASCGHYKFSAFGGLAHTVLHEARQAFDDLLVEFVEANGWLADEELQLRLDIDLLNRPYLYSNTPPTRSGHLRRLEVLQMDESSRLVGVPGAVSSKVGEIIGLESSPGERVAVHYHSSQMPFMKGKSREANYSYCNDRLHMMRSLLPVWSARASL